MWFYMLYSLFWLFLFVIQCLCGLWVYMLLWISCYYLSIHYYPGCGSAICFPEQLSSPPVFSRVRVTRSLVLCLCFVSSVLQFTASDYPFGIFKLFCHAICQLNYLNCGSLCSLGCCDIMSSSLLYTIFVSTIYLLVSMAYIKLSEFKYTTRIFLDWFWRIILKSNL